jgi:hypothetical protein
MCFILKEIHLLMFIYTFYYRSKKPFLSARVSNFNAQALKTTFKRLKDIRENWN